MTQPVVTNLVLLDITASEVLLLARHALLDFPVQTLPSYPFYVKKAATHTTPALIALNVTQALTVHHKP